MEKPPLIHGWTLLAHPIFIEQLDSLKNKVNQLKKRDPKNYHKKNTSKRLAAITRLALDIIPQDPTLDEYRQGKTLGDEYTHWFRAKFFQQYRLFFRFHKKSKIIVYAWVNDEKTKRSYGSKTDACRCFQKMLEHGNPPNDWDQLLAEVRTDSLPTDEDFFG